MQNNDTQLVQKLGIQPGNHILFMHEPSNYRVLLGNLPENVVHFETLQRDLDIIQYFTQSPEELEKIFPKLALSIKDTGAVWISWVNSANKNSDLNEKIVRDIGLTNDMVDTREILINQTWCAIKFVYQLEKSA